MFKVLRKAPLAGEPVSLISVNLSAVKFFAPSMDGEAGKSIVEMVGPGRDAKNCLIATLESPDDLIEAFNAGTLLKLRIWDAARGTTQGNRTIYLSLTQVRSVHRLTTGVDIEFTDASRLRVALDDGGIRLLNVVGLNAAQ